MVDGWCVQLHRQLEQNLSNMMAADTWAPVAERSQGAPMALSSSAVDVFVELDRLMQVYIHFAKLKPLTTMMHHQVTSLVSHQTVEYVKRVLAGCVERPSSRLAAQRGNADATGLVGRLQPVGRSAALDSQTLKQLLLRLNACEWAGVQFLALMNQLHSEIADVGDLPGVSETARRCEAACSQMLEYIQAISLSLSLTSDHFTPNCSSVVCTCITCSGVL